MSEVPGIDSDMLERLRRGVPLVLGRTGCFRFDGVEVTHSRVASALRAGLDVTPEGEHIVHLGAQWCYLEVEDCPLHATSVSEDGEGLQIRLDDGRTVPLAVETLWEQPEQGLRATVPAAKSGRPLAVRFTNPAAVQLSAWIELGPEDETPVLTFGTVRQRIPDTSP